MSRFDTAIKIALPIPSQFSFGVMSTNGSQLREYPTFSLSYFNGGPVPDHNTLGDIQAVSTNFVPVRGSPTTPLDIMAFLQPRKELLDFSDSLYLSIDVPTNEANDLFMKIEDMGRFVLLVNTDNFCYTALVDDGSGEVLESSIVYRYLT